MLLAFGGCGDDALKILERQDAVVRNGMGSLPLIRDVNQVFGASNVDHFISSLGDTDHKPFWNSTALFGGRSQFELQFLVVIDYGTDTPIGIFGPVTANLDEITEVQVHPGGDTNARFMGGHWKLTADDLGRLATNGGDWAAIGIPIVTNGAPVPNFQAYVEQARRPLRGGKAQIGKLIQEAIAAAEAGDTNSSGPSAKPKDLSNIWKYVRPEAGCYEKMVRAGSRLLILPGEVEKLFGAVNVDHLISKFDSKGKIPVWHSVAYFGGRYQLLLQIPIWFDHHDCDTDTLGGLNSAMIQINEIADVSVGKDGVATAKLGNHWVLGPGGWEALVKNNGQWSVVNLPIVTNSPVAGFETYVTQERHRDLRERQEALDKTVRATVDAFKYPTVAFP